MRLRLVLTLILLASLACGGDNVPKPWVEREGQKEIIGTTTADGEAIKRPLVAESNRRVVGPEGGPSGIPVEEDYSSMHAAGVVTCPEGTERAGDREPGGTQFCTLPDGRRHGPFMSWHSNGETKEIGTYVEGMRSGTVTTWSKDGRKESAMRWVDGSPAGGEYFE